MRPRLASLALLLLALCRESSAGPSFTIESITSKSTQSSAVIKSAPPEKRQEIVKKNKEIASSVNDDYSKEDVVKIMDMVGNTIFMIGFQAAEILALLPDHFKRSLVNGVLCEITPEVEGKMKLLNGPSREKEVATSKAKTKVDCSVTVANGDEKFNYYTCFCVHKKPLLFCTLSILKEGLAKVPMKTCRKQALDKFKAAGPTLFKEYDLDDFGKKKFENEFSGGSVDSVTKNEDATVAQMFCDAMNSDVEKAVKELYAADALYWITEALLYSIVFGESDKGLANICMEDDFKNNDYGKCVCAQDTGFSFCIYKVIGEYFKNAGYLDCTKPPEAKKFVTEKKPEKPPPLAHRGSLSPAAATSMLLLPLSVAAALLLRH